jgi:hypothetical protein
MGAKAACAFGEKGARIKGLGETRHFLVEKLA